MKEAHDENGFVRPGISGMSESGSSVAASELNECEDHPTRPFSKICTRYESHKSAVYAVVFNPYQEHDEVPIFATCGSNMVNFYECHISEDGRHDSFTLVQSVRDKASDENFYTCTWCFDPTSPNSPHLLAAGGEYGFIRVIGASNGEDLACLRGHGNYINELRTSPVNSMLLASASKDCTIRLWNIRFDQCLAILGGINGHLDQVLSIDWSPDGCLIASCSMDHTIRVWDLDVESLNDRIKNTMKLVATVKPRRKWVFDYDCQLREEMAEYNAKRAKELEEKRKRQNGDERTNGAENGSASSASSETSRKAPPADDDSNDMLKKKTKDDPNKPLAFDEKPARQTPIMITSPVAKTDDLHIDYIDWIRFYGEYMISKWLPVGNKGGSIYFWRLDKGIPHREADFVLPIVYMTIRHIGWDPLGRVMIAVADGGSITLVRRRFKHEKVDERGAAVRYRHKGTSKGEGTGKEWKTMKNGKRRRMMNSEEAESGVEMKQEVDEDDRSTTTATDSTMHTDD
ncbi:hypothetical protein WR25_01664 [Diploscapter pachys]|uniref:Uncharacterized protein n=1 Tax=Diploscapter pachys TaxID=2018661 RepID=A0A2A2JSM4_9BILA|nr:hypothetical protein WR25_01664 [Diploscapter pachys]